MPASNDLQTIAVNDFSPGIYDDWFAEGGAVRSNPGAARKTGTFGCCSSRSGTLIAGPRRVNRLLSVPTVDLTDSYDNTQRIMAFRCMSPVWDRTSVGPFESGDVRVFPDMLAFAFESFVNSATPAAFDHVSTFIVYKMFMEAAANPAVGTVPVYQVMEHNAGDSASNIRYGWSGIDLSRDNWTTPADIGYPIAGFVFTSNKNVTEYERLSYPDTSLPTADGSIDMAGLDQAGGFAGYAIFAHQDRLLLIDRSVNINMGTGGEVPTDLIIGTAPNDIQTTGVSLVAFVAENPGLFGAWATVNASEAFLVKQQRGGMAIRGDIDNPQQVVRLPGLPPTYDAVNIACAAQDGKVYYGSRTGVYAWSGGDTAESISRQLDGWFWNPEHTDDVLHCKGSFAAIERYLFAPNNFFYDMESKGWWRLTDAEDDEYLPYAWWDVSAAGTIIGAPNFLSDEQTTLADWYDIYEGQSEYNFVSQPLSAARNRSLNFRSLAIKAQGTGEITFTLYGRGDSNDYRPVTFRIDNTEPETFHFPLGADAYDPYYEIHAKADTTTAPAPSIISFELGYRDGATAPGTQI